MLNKALLIGHVGQEPEIRHTSSGGIVANFSLATTNKWKDKTTGEKVEHTEWHKITFFGNIAEVVKGYVHKGSKLYIEGEIKTEKWTDKEGKERYTTKIIGRELKLLDSKNSTSNGGANKPDVKQDDFDDDIPF